MANGTVSDKEWEALYRSTLDKKAEQKKTAPAKGTDTGDDGWEALYQGYLAERDSKTASYKSVEDYFSKHTEKPDPALTQANALIDEYNALLGEYKGYAGAWTDGKDPGFSSFDERRAEYRDRLNSFYAENGKNGQYGYGFDELLKNVDMMSAKELAEIYGAYASADEYEKAVEEQERRKPYEGKSAAELQEELDAMSGTEENYDWLKDYQGYVQEQEYTAAEERLERAKEEYVALVNERDGNSQRWEDGIYMGVDSDIAASYDDRIGAAQKELNEAQADYDTLFKAYGEARKAWQSAKIGVQSDAGLVDAAGMNYGLTVAAGGSTGSAELDNQIRRDLEEYEKAAAAFERVGGYADADLVGAGVMSYAGSVADTWRWVREATGASEEEVKRIEDFADSAMLYSAKSSEALKRGKSGAGQMLVDVGIQAVQMFIDTGLTSFTGQFGLGGGVSLIRDAAKAGEKLGAKAVAKALIPAGGMFGLGLRAFGGASQEARLNGATLAQQGAYAFATAATEVVSEKMFDAFGGIVYGGGALNSRVDHLIGRMAGTKAGQAAWTFFLGGVEEGLEEVFSDIVNPFALSLYNGKSVGQNLREVEADAVAYDFLVGAVMGWAGGFTGALSGDVDACAAYFRECGAEGVDFRTAAKDWNSFTEWMKSERSRTGMEEAFAEGAEAETATVTEEARERITEEQREPAADTLEEAIRRGRLNNTDARRLLADPVLAQKVSELTGLSLDGTMFERVKALQQYTREAAYRNTQNEQTAREENARWETEENTRQFMREGGYTSYVRGLLMGRMTADVAAEIVDDPALRAEWESIVNQGQSRKKTLPENRKSAMRMVMETKVGEERLNAVPLKTEETRAPAAKTESEESGKTATPARGTLEELAAQYGERAGRVFRSTFKAGQDIRHYSEGFRSAYEQGFSGKSYDALAGRAKSLSPEQRRAAWEAGRADGGSESTRRETLAREKGRRRGNGTVRGDNVSMDELSRPVYMVLRRVAEATGIDIVVYKSETDENGNFISDEGEFRYNEDAIYLDLYSGLKSIKDIDSLSQYTILRTFAHEFTHFNEKWSPKLYEKLRETVLEEMRQNVGEDELEAMIQRKLAAYRAKVSKSFTYDEAVREVVADALTDILPQSRFVEKLYRRDRGLAENMRQSLKDFLSGIREYFSKLTPNNRSEAVAAKTMADGQTRYVQSIVRVFDEMAVKGAENYRSAERGTADVESGSQKLIRVSAEDRFTLEGKTVNTLEALEEAERNGEVERVYRAMQIQPVDENGEVIDDCIIVRVVDYENLIVEAKTVARKGKPSKSFYSKGALFSPMAGQSEKGTWRNPIRLGEWERTEEHPERATMKMKDGQPVIDNQKGNASFGEIAYEYGLEKGGVDENGNPKTPVAARYNPYIHTSRSALNDQFSSANKRPELVTVETLIPKFELTSGYRAEKAKDRVGAMGWHSGPTSSRLAQVGKPRTVILSRFDKPIRIIPEREVAQSIADTIGDSENIAIPESVVTPALARELKAVGVPVLNKEEWDAYSKEHPTKSFKTEKGSAEREDGKKSQKAIREDAADYDFQKSFKQQLIDFKNGVFPKSDTILIGGTPEILKKIGLLPLPVTINASHVSAALNGDYKGTNEEILDHKIPLEEFAKLPQKIENPVAIIEDRPLGKKFASQYRVDVIVDFTVNGKTLLVPIGINSTGYVNGAEIDVNSIATAHGNSDIAIRFMNAVENDSDNDIRLYYVDKEKAAKLLRPTGNPISSTAKMPDGFIHSINDAGSPVKMRISDVTESKQFKRWFGDWQNHPESASKVVNADGTPRKVYHATNAKNIDVFQSGNSAGIIYFGFTKEEARAAARGKKYVREYYLDAKKPVNTPETALNWYDAEDSSKVSKWRRDEYDSVYVADEAGISIAVFNPEQIKSATDNIGTFDGRNPDTHYQLRESTLSDMEVLEQTGDNLNAARLTEAEKNALSVYRKRLDELKKLQSRQDSERARLAESKSQSEKNRLQGSIDSIQKQIDRAQRDARKAAEYNLVQGAMHKVRLLAEGEIYLKSREVRKLITENRRLTERADAGKERLDRVRAEKNAKIAEERRKGRERLTEYRERRDESDAVKAGRAKVQRVAGTMTAWLRDNTDKKHVPAAVREPLARLLGSIDFSSRRSLDGRGQTKGDREFANSIALFNRILAEESGDDAGFTGDFLDVSEENRAFLAGLVQTIAESAESYTVMDMNSEELGRLADTLADIRKGIENANAFLSDQRAGEINTTAQDTMQYAKGQGAARRRDTGTLNRLLNWKQTTPYDAFLRFGEGGKKVFMLLASGWDKRQQNLRYVLDWLEKLYKDMDVKKSDIAGWQSKARSYTLEDGREIRLSVGQLMLLYEHLKQEASLRHLQGGGLRVDRLPGKSNALNGETKFHFSEADIRMLQDALTDKQKALADQMQRFMAKTGRDFGNEVSLKRHGYEAFKEGDSYVPLVTDDAKRAVREQNRQKSLFTLLNMSATKARDPNANNALVLGDIFEVFSDHMRDMATYNGMALPILDTIKWFKYTERTRDGEGFSDNGTMTAIREAYGDAAVSYIRQLIYDLSDEKQSEGRVADKLLRPVVRNYKVASVGANLRVALLQGTSYARAGNILKAKYLAEAKKIDPMKAWADALAHSGTAVAKDMGIADGGISREVGARMKGTGVIDTLREKSMAPAERGDQRTFGALWYACKLQTAAETGATGEELNEKAAELFREVVYATQVMDGTLNRSEMMRSSSYLDMAYSAFMMEPVLSLNNLFRSASSLYRDSKSMGAKAAWEKNRAGIGRNLTVYLVTAASAALVESIVDAMRDDDEYESFLQKFREAMFGENGKLWQGNFAQDLTVVGKLPIVKDLMNGVFSQYENDDVPMEKSALANLRKVYRIWEETVKLQTGALEKATDVTYYGNMTTWGKIYKTLQAASQLAGLPAGNLARDAVAVWNTVVAANVPGMERVKTYDPGKKGAIRNSYLAGNMTAEEAKALLLETGEAEDENDAYWAVTGWDAGTSGVYARLYEAMETAGDVDGAIQELTEHGYSRREVNSQIAGKVGEWFKGTEKEAPSIDRAEAVSLLTGYAGLSKADAGDKVTAWECKKDTGYNLDELKQAYADGEITETNLRDWWRKYGGYTAEETEKKLLNAQCYRESGFNVTELGQALVDGELTRDGAVSLWQKYSGLTRREAEEKADAYVISDKYPDWTVDAVKGAVRDYNEYGSGVMSRDSFVNALYNGRNIKGTDADGDGQTDRNSKRDAWFEYIDSLALSREEKDALLLAAGYAASTLWKAPWNK